MNNWRFVPRGLYNGFTNMALDEVIRNYASATGTPVIRLYDWEPPTVSIGRKQTLKDIDLKKCRNYGLQIVRRITGGGAVIHGTGITYSIAIPASIVGEGKFTALFYEVTQLIRNSLSSLGIEAIVKNDTDIIVNGRKISGSAAHYSHEKKVYLMHGEIFFTADYKKWSEIYKIGANILGKVVTWKWLANLSFFDHEIWSKVYKPAAAVLRDKVVTINELVDATIDEAYEKFRDNFLRGKDYSEMNFTDEEISAAERLADYFRKNLDVPDATFSRGACPSNWELKEKGLLPG